MASFFAFILFLSNMGLVVQAGSMQIFRGEKKNTDDDFLLQKDTAECPKSGSEFTPACGNYSAESLASCRCKCGGPSGNYTFFERNNSCVKVAEARRLSGMVIICLLNNY